MKGLAPCPFCEEREQLRITAARPGGWLVCCHACGACGPISEEDDEGQDAEEQWNRRAAASWLRIERLRGFLPAPAGRIDLLKECRERLDCWPAYWESRHEIDKLIQRLDAALAKVKVGK